MKTFTKQSLIPHIPAPDPAWTPEQLHSMQDSGILLIAHSFTHSLKNDGEGEVLCTAFFLIQHLLEGISDPIIVSWIHHDRTQYLYLIYDPVTQRFQPSQKKLLFLLNPWTSIIDLSCTKQEILNRLSPLIHWQNPCTVSAFLSSVPLTLLDPPTPSFMALDHLSAFEDNYQYRKHISIYNNQAASLMDVPEVPAAFLSDTKQRFNTRFIPIPHKEKKTEASLTCPACSRTFSVQDVSSTEKTECPHCHIPLQLIDEESAQNLKPSQNMRKSWWLLQPSSDRKDLFMRGFTWTLYSKNNALQVKEIIRIRISSRKKPILCGKRINLHDPFQPGNIYLQSLTPSCFDSNDSITPIFYNINPSHHSKWSDLPKGTLWTSNWNTDLKGTRWEYLPACPDQVTKKFALLLNAFHPGCWYEHLSKQGFHVPAQHMINSLPFNQQLDKFNLQLTQTRVDKILNIPIEIIRSHKEILIETLSSTNAVEFLCLWQTIGSKKGGPECIQKLYECSLSYSDIYRLKKMIAQWNKIPAFQATTSIRPLLRYINQYPNACDAFKMYDDYLMLARQAHVDLSSRSQLFPSDLLYTHDLLTEQINDQKTMSDPKTRTYVNNNLHLVHEACQPLTYESDQYRLIFPDSYSDLNHEGSCLHHCVAGYYKRIIDKSTLIAFIRSQEHPEKPYYTLELHNWNIAQLHGLNNCSAPDSVQSFAEQWIHHKVQPLQRKYPTFDGQRKYLTQTCDNLQKTIHTA